MMTSPKLTFEQVQAEAQKRQLVLSRDSKHGFRLDIDPQSGLSWRDFPSMVADLCKRRFETLGYVMSCLRLIDSLEDYDRKAFLIAQEAKQWLERTNRSTSEEMIQRLLEHAIRRIPDLRLGEVAQFNEQAQQRLQQWIADNGIWEKEAACKQAGFLVHKQLETACVLRIIRCASPPPECRLKNQSGELEDNSWFSRPLTMTETAGFWDTGYYYPCELTSEQLRTINEETLVSRKEAAEILGVTEQQFDRLKQEYELMPVNERRSRRNQQIYYLYRLSDVFRLDMRLRQVGE